MSPKPDFKQFNNPALQFLSEPEEVEVMPEPTTEKPIRKKRETKSKRLNLLIYPSLYEACMREAYEKGESINEYINMIIREHFIKE